MGRRKVRPASGHRVHKSKLHQESERARPSQRLRQEGKKRSAQGQTRAEQSAVKAEKAKLRMGAAQEKLAAQAPAKPPGPVKRGAGALGWGVHGFVHGKIYEVEHENVGTEGAHHSELVGEAVGRKTARTVRRAVRDHPARAAARAEARYVKATAEHRFQVEQEKHPDLGKNALARFAQKQRQKRQYAKQAREAAKQGAKAAEKTAASAEKLAEKVAGFVKRHPVGVVIALCCVLLLFTIQSCASSLVTLGNGIIGGIGASTYPAQDGDMLGAEAAYCALEAELQHYLDTYTSTHDYDEYHFDLDETVFYLVIDRQRGAENVYFLNAVTVSDLMALAEQDQEPEAPPPVTEPDPEPEPAPAPEPEPEKSGGAGMLLAALAVLALGGGAGWYFKIYRPKQQRAAEPEEDHADYDEPDDYDDAPPWDVDDEDEGGDE